MNGWLKAALVGIEGSAPLPADGEIGALMATVAAQGDDPAQGYCRVVGVLAACRLAALSLPPPAVLPTAATADAQALADDHPACAALASAFVEGPLRLQYEACLRLAEVDAHLPAALLPSALQAGQRQQVLRAALLPRLGARGEWLAACNPDWRYAASSGESAPAANDEEQQWQQGSIEQRAQYFRALRRRDPAAANALLQAQLGELTAKERAALVELLAIGLQADDAALLESLLKDRSREVRYLAARLLALLPDAAHARRLCVWTAELVTSRRGMLGRSWQCEAPAMADPEWAGAAIEPSRPQHETLGERAWWLYQLVRQVPLAWWCEHTGMRAAELLAWAARSDWAEALQRGWRERVGAADPEWIEAMLASNAPIFRHGMSDLLALLPMAQRERHWPRNLAELQQAGLLGPIIGACAPGETLSAGYSAALLPSLHALLEGDALRQDYGLRAVLLELATLLHPDSLPALRLPPRRGDETPALAECLTDFQRIVAVRRTLHDSLARSTRSTELR
jgi:hypothetical protein